MNTMILLLFVIAAASAEPVSAPSSTPSGKAQSQATKDQAQAEVDIGQSALDRGRPQEAQPHCEAAVKLDPTGKGAKDCLNRATAMFIDQDLDQADAKLRLGDKKGAIDIASKWTSGTAQPAEARARKIVKDARARSPQDIFRTLTPDWLRQLMVTIVILCLFALFLLLARKLWREWQRGKWYGNLTNKTVWRMIPLKELPAGTDVQTGMATDAILDALARVGEELRCNLWSPKLLLLRPTPPANYEPAIISEFLSDSLPSVALAPGTDDLCLEWELHDVQLDQAVQNLQLRVSTGVDLGSVARFLQSVVQWFKTGTPAISGIAQTDKDKNVLLHLAAGGGRTSSVSITTSTDYAPGISPIELSAERAAFKFLFRMRYPELTNDQIDGFSALRQGAAQFAQYAETVPGIGEDAKKRTSSLGKAAFNLSFFRASIPSRQVGCSEKAASLRITDDIRQSVLLAEGVAHTLVGAEQEQMLAIDCFHQLQDWPGSPETEALRHQAAYNEAIVLRELKRPGECVLHLTELLGERTPDTMPPQARLGGAQNIRRNIHDAIRFPARVARLSAFAQYNLDDWVTLPLSRAQMLIDDAEKLVGDLDEVSKSCAISPHDLRLARYMYTETLRSIGHIELMAVIAGHATNRYCGLRPTDLSRGDGLKEGADLLNAAIHWMHQCEQLKPTCGLYCDLAEAYLLLRDFSTAQGYARHAVLDSDPNEKCDDERAYYLATKSFFLQDDTEECRAKARKYAEGFKGTVTLDEFKSLRADLGVDQTQPFRAESKRAA